MATTEEIARDLLASMNTDAGFLNAIKWIDYRYKELCNQVRFRHLREIGEYQIPARVSTGVVAASRNVTTITGTSTSWSSVSPGATIYDNWYFRCESAWYKISTVDSSTQITLATAYSEDGGASQSYNIVQRYHSLHTNARHLGDFVHTRLRANLEVCNLGKLDRDAPGRVQVGSFPTQVAQLGTDSSGDIQVEFYPYSDDSEIIHYVYWSTPTALAITSTIPSQIDPYVLREGALIDLYRYMKAKALAAGQNDTAAILRNDEHAQRTVWRRIIQEARRADRGVDDTTFILQHLSGVNRISGDITDARDEIYYRANRSW